MIGFNWTMSFPAGACLFAFTIVRTFVFETLHAFLRWLDQELPVVLAYVLSEKIEPVLNVRDDGLLLGEGEAAFVQELLYRWLDFLSSTSLELPEIRKSSAYRMR